MFFASQICNAQGLFKNKTWVCFNQGDWAADKKNGDARHLGTIGIKSYYNFSNGDSEGGLHFIRYTGLGGNEDSGTWSDSGQTLTLTKKIGRLSNTQW
jgi:hypothetical protein